MPRRRRRSNVARFAVTAFAAAILLALVPESGRTQTPTQTTDPNADLLAPSLSGNPANPPTFGRSPQPGQTPPADRFTGPSRVGAIPTYGSPTGFGAGDTGFDSQNRSKRQRTARVPAKDSSIAAPTETFDQVPAPPPQVPSRPPVLAQPPAPVVYPAKAASRPGAILPPMPTELPISNPPAEIHPAASANRRGAVLPIPEDIYFQASASTPAPGTPQPNTLPLGAVPQATLPIAAGDPYEQLGIKAGSFLILPAVELSAGYDNNPQHAPGGGGSPEFIVAPELHVRSDWVRHSLTADVAGSYTEYTNDSFVPPLSRPYLNAKTDGRIDVTRDTQVLLEGRVIVSTDNPGSPNIQAGLAKLPIGTTVGGTLGLNEALGRFDVSLKGTVDRSMYQDSQLTDGTTASNEARNFDQFGGILRLGYEVEPGLKPFVELNSDTRIHDVQFDELGEDRDSTGVGAKAGAELKITNWLTGEMAVGYLERDYHDPTLPNIGGMTVDGSLLWQATALTTAKFTAASSVGESVLQGVSGSFSRDFNIQVDHSFRSWLIGTLQAGYGHDNYVGLDRQDNRYFVSGGVTYKMNREVQIKAEVRHDWLTSSQPGNAYEATSALLTLRLQR
ncbi:MAG TPA: outer membrane beta-barrel protein [Xanthobacteraceae bacterium]|nr:outer membrane beta-barrel protein [Xanthobacteraceae bacterium]